jgi:F0F1-type ATP synthase membrane subunit b/b'
MEAKKKRLAELQEKVKILAEERHRKIEQRVEQFEKFKRDVRENVSKEMKASSTT